MLYISQCKKIKNVALPAKFQKDFVCKKIPMLIPCCPPPISLKYWISPWIFRQSQWNLVHFTNIMMIPLTNNIGHDNHDIKFLYHCISNRKMYSFIKLLMARYFYNSRWLTEMCAEQIFLSLLNMTIWKY